MAHITADRVRDTSTSTGTGNFTVSGTAPTGFRTLSAVLSVSDTFYYAIQGQGSSEWEVGLGTYSSANVFARTTILSSSNSGSVVTFSAGTKDVFLTLAATKTIQTDGSGNVGLGTTSPSASLSIVKQTTALSGTGNAYGLYAYPTSSGAQYLDAITGSSGNTSLTLRTYNNGTYYSAGLDNAGNFSFNSGYGSSATAYGCRAWVNWNGTNGSIRGSGGVSSVTYNGTSDYTINFSFTMPDANYSAVSMASKAAVSSGSSGLMCIAENSAPGTTSMRVYNNPSNNGGATQNYTYLHVAVFR
jgi:hypothetical protein